MSLFSFSCKNNQSQNKAIYAYGTEEFEKKTKELKYSLEDAVNIYCQYMFEKKQQDTVKFYTRIIYDNDYIFSKSPYNEKTGNYLLSGIWINGETGEVKEVSTTQSIKIILEDSGLSYKSITKLQFEKNGGSAFEK